MARQKFRKNTFLGMAVKCDTDGCGYKYEIPRQFVYLDEYTEYIRSFLGKNCPVCGAPLLTKRDFLQMLLLVKFLHNPVVIAFEKVHKGKEKVYRAEVDKDHNLEIREVV